MRAIGGERRPEAPEIRTERLVLRRFELADAADLFAIRGDAEAMRYWDWPRDARLADSQAVARGYIEEIESGAAIYRTARRTDGAFVGVFDLSELAEPRADLGFMVTRAMWGQGYGLEGARAMVADARRLGLPGLKARIHSGNEGSRRLLQRLGFQADGARRAVEVAPGRIVDCEVFALDL